jgi:SAM-dependent methyltransferase
MAPELKSFDRVASCYDATRRLPTNVESDVAQGILRALREVAADPRVLEVGIGTGRIAAPLAAAGARIVGIDIAPAMIAQLRAKRRDVSVALAEASRLPFRGGAFDGALFVHILHLLPDATAVLQAAAAIVRRRGVLLYGRTSYSENPLRQVMARALEIAHELTGLDLPHADWHAVADAAFAAQARAVAATVDEVVLARWPESATGRVALAAVEGRLFSTSWSIPDAVLPELVARLTPWVESLFGGLEKPVEMEVTFKLLSMRLGG